MVEKDFVAELKVFIRERIDQNRNDSHNQREAGTEQKYADQEKKANEEEFDIIHQINKGLSRYYELHVCFL